MHFAGLSKTKFHSSVCLIPEGDMEKMQIWSTERLTRQKDTSAWPLLPLQQLVKVAGDSNMVMAENRDVERPLFLEEFYNEQFPFFEMIEKNNLTHFTARYNPSLNYISHHLAHAYAALAFSPFEKSLIVVMDGAGSHHADLNAEELSLWKKKSGDHEECTVYLQEKASLKPVMKRFLSFRKSPTHTGHVFAEGAGYFFEKISEYIFNDSNSAGKVMGLAPFGKAIAINSRNERTDFLEHLDWNRQFKGKSKKEWEESELFSFYCDLAATAQAELEKDYDQLITELKNQFPHIENLILTGGCALNCTNNARLIKKKIFKTIYVTPFPGDESISLGTAVAMLYQKNPDCWTPFSRIKQRSYWGPVSSIPVEKKLQVLLQQRNIPWKMCDNVLEDACLELIDGKILGWFQGRSESGPRALGNRSILARPDQPGLKNKLNATIKFREAFRPYGCTVLHQKASEYFEVAPDFENPFMSFAVPVKPACQNLLAEVTHVDGTSRMQTLHREQNPEYYDLISLFGQKTGLHCLLNTSLNVMGEPILETMEDAVRFFESTAVDALYIGKMKLCRGQKA